MSVDTCPSDGEIVTEAALEAHYGPVNPNAVTKELDHVGDQYRALIAASPFVVLATARPEGLDASPRGDPPGFVEVDETGRTLFLPDRPGNNRIDSLRNIVRDPRVALLFLIPGIGETLRVNGRASIGIAPDLLQRFAIGGKPPRSVIRIEVASVYFQCQKAIVRSRLWDGTSRQARSEFASTGTMLAATSADTVDGAAYDRDYPERMARTIY